MPSHEPSVDVRLPVGAAEATGREVRVLEDRGTLVIHRAHQVCQTEVEVEEVATVCHDVGVSYRQGRVVIVDGDTHRTVLGRTNITEGSGTCGTRAIDQTVEVADVTVEFRGYRTVRCSGGGPPAPMIF